MATNYSIPTSNRFENLLTDNDVTDNDETAQIPTLPSTPEVLPKRPAVTAGHSPPGLKRPGVSLSPHFTFSARTCLAFVDKLTPEQVETEVRHLLALNATADNRADNSVEQKRSLLYKHLSKSLCIETDKIVNNFHLLLSNFSRSGETFERESGAVTRPEHTQDLQTNEAERVHPVADGNGQLSSPVRFYDIDVSDLSYESVKSSIKFSDTQRGGRETAYFGSVPYQYGPIKHDPIKYPDTPLFNKLFDALKPIVPDINPSNYSCLATYYANGNVTIPMHSDNEKCIEANSQIVTVSFGAPRTLKFRSAVGPQLKYSIVCHMVQFM